MLPQMKLTTPLCILLIAFLLSTLPAIILLYAPRRFAYGTTPSSCCGIHEYHIVNLTSFDIPTQQSIRLTGWFFPSQILQSRHPINKSNSNACILVVHGHGANMARYMGYGGRNSVLEKAVTPLLAAGFNVLAIDLRNHGTSDGASPVSLGLYESADVLAGVEWLANKANCGTGGIHRIGVWGESMGASSVIFAASSPRATSIKATVLDSSFSSAREVIDPWVKSKAPWVPSLLVSYWLAWFNLLGPFNLNDIDPSQHIKKIKCPIMVAHGRGDIIVPFSHSTLLLELARSRNPQTSSIVLTGSGIDSGCNEDWSLCYFFHDDGHVDAFRTLDYHTHMINFFEQHL